MRLFVVRTSVSLCVPLNPVARQRFGIHVLTSTNMQTTIEEFSDPMFLCCPCHIKYSVLPGVSCICLHEEYKVKV